MAWIVGSHGSGKRHWFILDDEVRYKSFHTSTGNVRWFGSWETAQKKADALNLAEGVDLSSVQRMK